MVLGRTGVVTSQVEDDAGMIQLSEDANPDAHLHARAASVTMPGTSFR
jgi:hypothetical protein